MSNCKNCKFKQHAQSSGPNITCVNPIFTKIRNHPFFEMLSNTQAPPNFRALKALGLTISESEVSGRNCHFPLNYDPLLIQGECKGFLSDDSKKV